MKGVMIPSVSAGSTQREASVMGTPHVSIPSGPAAAGDATATTRSSATRAGLMGSSLRTDRVQGSGGRTLARLGRGDYDAPRHARPRPAAAGPLHGARPDASAGRPHVRAPAGRLGRAGHQG